jgi:hypothetical protein
MDTGTLSPVAVLRDAPSALLRTRVDDFYRYDSNFEIAVLKRFPSDLNRWDSQRLMDERVFVH